MEFPDGNAWARLSDKPEVPDPTAAARARARARPASDDKRSGVAKILGAFADGASEEARPPVEDEWKGVEGALKGLPF